MKTEEARERWPKVAIIVLNWNGWQDTIECLESLYQITYPNYEVIVVDNGSKDNSIEMIRKYCEGELTLESKFILYNHENKPISIKEFAKDEIETKRYIHNLFENSYVNDEIIIIKNEKNYGFAEGNNIGIKIALNNGAKYIFMLNNDTVVASNFLGLLVDAMEKSVEIGISGPTCYYYERPDAVWQAGLKINWWTGEIKNIESVRVQEVDCVSGCAVLIKNTVFKNISLLDARFPFGNEDFEFCTRARRKGFRVVHVPDSRIWHKVSMSRIKLMKNMAERKALIGDAGDFRLKDKFLFLDICTPRKIQRISQNVFYFAYALPLLALRSCKRSGTKVTLMKARNYFQEIIGTIK